MCKLAYWVLKDFLLAPACPIKKVTLREGFLYFMSGSETEGVAKEKVFTQIENRTGTPGLNPSTLSTIASS